jgi:2-keto-4-pentenoate hydratase/2-oxohepta-3-ene-1,7-dioic acid hydratase in catechol pathway
LPAEDFRAPVPSPRPLPGDVIFTGTPPAVGHARKPPGFLRAGETLVSRIGGVSTLTTNFV